jgi:16S rRNA (guanine527-N7)-methyltransferase
VRKARNIGDSERAALSVYSDLVGEFSGRLDLVAPGDLERFHERHLEDSLRLLPIVEDAPVGPCVDVGSGAGLPGIPAAICTPQRQWRLVEPRRRRAAFLEECVRRLGLRNVEVIATTAEDAAGDPALAGAHALGTARALAPPLEAQRLVAPLVAPGGVMALFVGERAELPPKAELVQGGIAIVRRSDEAGVEDG